MLQILDSTRSEGTLANSKEAFMPGDPSVQRELLYAEPPPQGLPVVPEEALARSRSLRIGERHIRMKVENGDRTDERRVRNECVRASLIQQIRDRWNSRRDPFF